MLKINKKQIIILLIILILIVGLIYYFYVNNTQDNMDFLYLEESNIEEKNIENDEIKVEKMTDKKEIVVHIMGEVINSGIVKLAENSRIIDAIEAAGGTTSEADLKKINLAFILSDGQKVYIPSVKEEKK